MHSWTLTLTLNWLKPRSSGLYFNSVFSDEVFDYFMPSRVCVCVCVCVYVCVEPSYGSLTRTQNPHKAARSETVFAEVYSSRNLTSKQQCPRLRRKEQQTAYVKHNTEVRLLQWKNKEHYIFLVCVLLTLGIQHAMRMYHIIICDLPRSTTFSLQLLSEKCFILRRTEWDMATNVHRSSCKVPVILVRL